MRPLDDPRLRDALIAMDGFPAPWCIAGGWAIDLFLGRVTRPHADVEIAIFRQDQSLLHRQLPGWNFEKVVDGARLGWPPDERLILPVHEIHAHRTSEPRISLEFLLNERTAADWRFRRDPGITLPRDRWIVRGDDDVPILSPAIVLLFKAKATRAKDELDFQSARQCLGLERQQWLAAALRASNPHHPWLIDLQRSIDQ